MIVKFPNHFYCRFTWSQGLQFPEEARPTDDSGAVAGTSQRRWILHNLFSFSSLHVLTGRNQRSS